MGNTHSSPLDTKNGTAVHPIGIGTWTIAGVWDETRPPGRYEHSYAEAGNETQETAGLRYSLTRGQNHIDTAELYGAFYTDEVVGHALAPSNSDVPRESLFLADKLWKHSVAFGEVRPTVEQMLTKLQTSYLDLLYIHAPWPEVPWHEALPQIDDLIDEGLVRYLGVSNFTIDDMETVRARARHPLAANQMNFSCVYQREVTPAFRTYCAENDVQIVAYEPLKRGVAITNPVVNRIAAKREASPAQVALAWLLAHNTLPIPKSTSIPHIDDNLGAVDLTLQEEDLKQLDGLSPLD